MPTIKETFYGIFRQFSSTDDYTDGGVDVFSPTENFVAVGPKHQQKQQQIFSYQQNAYQSLPRRRNRKNANNNGHQKNNGEEIFNQSKNSKLEPLDLCSTTRTNINHRRRKASKSDKVSDISATDRSDSSENCCFIKKYLSGKDRKRAQPEIYCGKTGIDLPVLKVEALKPKILAAYTGPDGGLTNVSPVRNKGPMINLANLDDELCISLETDCMLSTSKNRHSQSIDESDRRQKHPKNNSDEDDLSPLSSINNLSAAYCNNLDITRQKSAHQSGPSNIHPADWYSYSDFAYGLSTSLYERNPITRVRAGNPIADVFGVVARDNNCILALADGVNWGEKSRLAALCAVRGALDYLSASLYAKNGEICVSSTLDVFHHLLKAFHAGHHLIIQEGGSLTTLCVVVVCPLRDVVDQWVACACNVGDSLAFVYNPNSGVREITLGSHDIQQMRDMRDAGGALGPVDGVNPELHNMTCSMTVVEPGDIIFLTSDGVSDNFDPVVGKFCLIDQKEINGASIRRAATARSEKTESVVDREIISTKTDNGPKQRSESVALPPNGMCFSPTDNQLNGLPVVEAYQRHELMLLRLEDMLQNGITLGDPAVTSAQQLCETLINFVIQLTTAKRKTLEDPDFYKNESHLFDHHSSAAVVRAEQKKRRQMVRQKISEMPGKLDHASVVAYRVASSSSSSQSANDLKNAQNANDIGKSLTSPSTYLTNEDRFNFVKDNQIVIHQSGSDEEPDESWLLTLFYDNSEWAADRQNGDIRRPMGNFQNGALVRTPLSPTVASDSRRSFSKPPMSPPPVARKASSKNVSGGDCFVETAKNVEPIPKLTRNASESLTCPTIMENAADRNLIERNGGARPRFRKLSKTIEKIVDGVRRPKKHGRGSPQRHTLAVDRSDLPSMNRNGVDDDDFRSPEDRQHQRSSFASTSGGATAHCFTLPQTSLMTAAAATMVENQPAPSPTPSKRFLSLKNNRKTWSPMRSLKFLKNAATHRAVFRTDSTTTEKNDQTAATTPDDENLVTICDKFEIEGQNGVLSSPSTEHEAIFVRKSSSSSQVSFTANDSQFLATKFYLESLV